MKKKDHKTPYLLGNDPFHIFLERFLVQDSNWTQNCWNGPQHDKLDPKLPKRSTNYQNAICWFWFQVLGPIYQFVVRFGSVGSGLMGSGPLWQFRVLFGSCVSVLVVSDPIYQLVVRFDSFGSVLGGLGPIFYLQSVLMV